MTEKRFTITQDFEEHHRQIRDNGHIIMGCFLEPQAEPIVKLLNELHEENQTLKSEIKDFQELLAGKEEELLKPIRLTIQEAYETERTQIGKSVLKQLLQTLE